MDTCPSVFPVQSETECLYVDIAGYKTLVEWPFQEQRGFDLTASAPVSDDSAPACTNGLWPPLRPESVAQNKPSTQCCPQMSNPSTSPLTARLDGSGQ